MKSALLLSFSLLFGSISWSQNPAIIKTVGGSSLEPASNAQVNSRVRLYNNQLFIR